MNAKGGKKAPKKKTNGHQMPEPIKSGEILTDVSKKQWIIGTSIGVGGFGEIYAAAPYTGKTPKEYPAVIKIEPHGNGPLFVEMHFYMRNAKSTEIDAHIKKKKLKHLGMPKFLASGSHEYNGTKYRFLVVEKYGRDLWKLFLENGRKFPEPTVYQIALQVIDVLEYIHGREYIHGDIKGANLLLGIKSPNNVFLVDFGLACHYTKKDEFTPDPKKAHDGTPEYLSRDAHKGVSTMRGDFEILSYNIIQWLIGKLPWENIQTPTEVQKQKEKAYENIPKFLKTCFGAKIPEPVTKFLKLTNALKFDENPDYEKFKEIFVQGLKQLGHKSEKLEFKVVNSEPEKKDPAVRNGERKSPRGKKAEKDLNQTVCDAKAVSGEDARNKVLASINSDSEAEYDVYIKKRKKKETEDVDEEEKVAKKGRAVRKTPEKKTPSKTTPKGKGKTKASSKARAKVLDYDSDSDMFDSS